MLKKVARDNELKAVLEELSDLYLSVNSAKPHLLAIGLRGRRNIENDLVSIWSKHSRSSNRSVENLSDYSAENIAYIISAKVNFCAAAYPTVAENHPDSAALSVLGSVLRNGFLHSEIREKGARMAVERRRCGKWDIQILFLS